MAGFADLRDIKRFKGTPEDDARRWLSLFDRQNQIAQATPARWLKDFDMMMDLAAADWSNDELQEYVESDTITEATVETVRNLLLQKFKRPTTAVDARSAIQQINNLAQMSDEKLSDYHGRTASLLRKVKGEDNANATGVGASMLMMTIDAFLKGLHNPELRLILSRESPSTLQAALEKAEAAQRQMEVEARLKREQQTLKDNDQMKEAVARMLQGQPVSAELRAKMQEITGVKPSSKSVNYADTAEIIPPPLSFYPP
ncbi:unnamed protein product [Zymoseptoria tritici ST99CH_3D1]|nr:unnamed protein product [Zymoseptoria tritici ST99CH_3D1]